jgi:hypothetical protein
MAPDGSKLKRLGENGWFPRWSPDGKYVACLGTEKKELFVLRPDGRGRRSLDDSVVAFSWAPDSGRLAYLRARVLRVLLPNQGALRRALTDLTEMLSGGEVQSSPGQPIQAETSIGLF